MSRESVESEGPCDDGPTDDLGKCECPEGRTQEKTSDAFGQDNIGNIVDDITRPNPKS